MNAVAVKLKCLLPKRSARTTLNVNHEHSADLPRCAAAGLLRCRARRVRHADRLYALVVLACYRRAAI